MRADGAVVPTCADCVIPAGTTMPNMVSRFTKGSTTSGTTSGNATKNLPGHYHGMGSGSTASTSIGFSGGTASLTGSTTFPSTSHAHNLNDFGYAQINVVEAGGNTIADFRRTTGPVTTYSSNIRMATATGGGFSGHTQGIALSGRTDNLSTDTTSVGISHTPGSITGSNAVTGSIGLVTGGCDGNSGASCSINVEPAYMETVWIIRVK
jgi:hypothetical protein